MRGRHGLALRPDRDPLLLVRGAQAGPEETWPLERRRVGGRLLSDHAPVEVRLA